MRYLYIAASAAAAVASAFDPSSSGVQSRRDALTNLVSAASATTVLAFPAQPALAGVGAPVPFDETRKVLFPGSLMNSVAALRIESALRYTNISESRRKQNLDEKKRAKYGPKNTLIVCCSCSDDATPVADTLAGMLGKDMTKAGVE